MRLAMTLMVRDEADVVGAMLDHHLAQGVDTIIVTDNGSVDGTAELLQRYADEGRIELRHDPVHRKQQAQTVTAMARDAFARHGADWVINADADEFWYPVAHSAAHPLTLKQAFEGIPAEVGTFAVPVYDMVGAPALDGSGLQRLLYRDLRPVEVINAVGIRAHPTPDSPHVGRADIEVVQGNHFVNLEQGAPVPDGCAIEVLHFPWRSWRQLESKVGNAGRAYEASDLTPSPNHHGMRDYRRLVAGTLFPLYLARHPEPDEIAAGLADDSLVRDDRVALERPSPRADVPVPEAERARMTSIGRELAALEHRLDQAQAQADRVPQLEAENERLAAEVAALRSRRAVRIADGIARRVPGSHSRDR